MNSNEVTRFQGVANDGPQIEAMLIVDVAWSDATTTKKAIATYAAIKAITFAVRDYVKHNSAGLKSEKRCNFKKSHCICSPKV